MSRSFRSGKAVCLAVAIDFEPVSSHTSSRFRDQTLILSDLTEQNRQTDGKGKLTETALDVCDLPDPDEVLGAEDAAAGFAGIPSPPGIGSDEGGGGPESVPGERRCAGRGNPGEACMVSNDLEGSIL